MHLRTLVLDREYTPHRTVSWHRGLSLVFSDKAEVIEEYEECVQTVYVSFPVPAVVRLRNPIPKKKKVVRFNRHNVFLRDKGVCQYCGDKLSLRTLTYDHATPRSSPYYGKTNFENIVSACYPCNLRKGNRTPWDAKMILRADPVRPDFLPLVTWSLDSPTVIPDLWRDYLRE